MTLENIFIASIVIVFFLQAVQIASLKRRFVKIQSRCLKAEETACQQQRRINNLSGRMDQIRIKNKVGEKFAERAFTMASNANIACNALAGALHKRRRPLSDEELKRNELAKKKIDELFGNEPDDWFHSTLDEKERKTYENAMVAASEEWGAEQL